MTKILHYILLLTLCLATASCSGKKEPPVPKVTPRSVLVYMVANNSLGRDGYDNSDIIEMTTAAEAGDFGDSRLIVYHHPRRGTPTLKEITAQGIVTLCTYDDATFSSDPARMKEVIADFKQMAPAENYGLVLWSHGSGWMQDGYEFSEELNVNQVEPLSFGQDGMSSDARGSRRMNVTDLAKALDGQGFDYVYFDCCYMGGIEVMYQLRNVTPTIVASATELPADGMPYHHNLVYLLSGNKRVVEAARSTYEHYNMMYGADRTCTMVVVNTEPLDRLAQLTAEIYSRKVTLPTGFAPQRYTLDTPCRYFDFRQVVQARCPDEELFVEWSDVYKDVIEYKAETPKLWDAISLAGHSGLSTNLITRESEAQTKNYYQLDWYKDVVIKLFE